MLNGKENHGKNLMSQIILIKNIIAKIIYEVNVNKDGVKCGTSLRFWENKCRINSIDPYAWFQWYFRYWSGKRR